MDMGSYVCSVALTYSVTVSDNLVEQYSSLIYSCRSPSDAGHSLQALQL